MKRPNEWPHFIRWQPDDPYVIEASDVGRTIPEFCTVRRFEPEHVGRYFWRRDGKAWVESEDAYRKRTGS